MSKHTPETANTLSDENVKAVMRQAEDVLNKTVPAQTTEEKPVVETASDKSQADLVEYHNKLGTLSNAITDAMLSGDIEAITRLTEESKKLMDEHRGATEKTSTFEGLKNKTLDFLKNNKKTVLISTGVTVALGVIVKIALGQPTDEEELVEDDSAENSEIEIDSV
jgi:methyl coenzyme M reductase subunit C-like uncharacterized protein (methanogenesis marker protein 7)